MILKIREEDHFKSGDLGARFMTWSYFDGFREIRQSKNYVFKQLSEKDAKELMDQVPVWKSTSGVNFCVYNVAEDCNALFTGRFLFSVVKLLDQHLEKPLIEPHKSLEIPLMVVDGIDEDRRCSTLILNSGFNTCYILNDSDGSTIDTIY